jgi:hypothetical protein
MMVAPCAVTVAEVGRLHIRAFLKLSDAKALQFDHPSALVQLPLKLGDLFLRHKHVCPLARCLLRGGGNGRAKGLKSSAILRRTFHVEQYLALPEQGFGGDHNIAFWVHFVSPSGDGAP